MSKMCSSQKEYHSSFQREETLAHTVWLFLKTSCQVKSAIHKKTNAVMGHTWIRYQEQSTGNRKRGVGGAVLMRS